MEGVPRLGVLVRLGLMVRLGLIVQLGERLNELLLDMVAVRLGDTDGLRLRVTVGDGLYDGVTLALALTLGATHAPPLAEMTYAAPWFALAPIAFHAAVTSAVPLASPASVAA